MPFFLVTVGLLMIVTGVRGTQGAFAAQVKNDFANAGTCNPLKKQVQGCGFIWWLVAIGAVGAIGYSEKARPLSSAFMTLVIVSMLLANKGFFTLLSQALQTAPVPPPASADPCGSGSGNNAGGNLNVIGIKLPGGQTFGPQADLSSSVSSVLSSADMLATVFV